MTIERKNAPTTDSAPGDPDLDHGKLLGRIDGLCARMTEMTPEYEVCFVLSEVHAALAAHFRLEESLMRERQFDHYNGHKAEHDALLQEIRGLLSKTGKAPASGLGPVLASRLNAWFAHHLEERDRHFHESVSY